MAKPARSPIVFIPTTMFSAAVMFALLAVGGTTQAQSFSLLHTFTGGNDGANPLAGLTLDRGGNLYGTAYGGGVNSPAGTVFKLKPAGSGWILTPLFEFSDSGDGGANPSGGVVFGPDGALYGTASGGSGFGTVFKLQPTQTACKAVLCYWTQTVLYRFTASGDGHQPTGNLMFDQAGNLYGTTPYGGINNCQGGCGVVFELTPSGAGWTEQVLYHFLGLPDAQRPYAGLTIDSAGNLYGASYEGGQNSGGTVFLLSPSGGGWNYSVLYNLSGSQNGPFARLTRDAAGNLYGATIIPSTIFELSPSNGSWIYTDLHDFSGNDGLYPRGSVTLDGQGNLYGTTSSGGADSQGTAWKLAP